MIAPYWRISYQGSRIFKQLNTDRSVLSLKGDGPYFRHSIRSGHVIGEPQVLFTKISEEQITTWRRLYAGQQPVVEDFPLNLVTGVIRSVSEYAMTRVSYCYSTHTGPL